MKATIQKKNNRLIAKLQDEKELNISFESLALAKNKIGELVNIEILDYTPKDINLEFLKPEMFKEVKII